MMERHQGHNDLQHPLKGDGEGGGLKETPFLVSLIKSALGCPPAFFLSL